jgi:hypothetical protein
MADRTLDAFPDRSVAMVRAFSPAIERGLLISGAIAVVAAILGTPLVVARLPELLAPAILAAIGTGIGVAVAYLSTPRGVRLAYEAYSWLGRTEMERFKERTGGPVPTKPADIDRWLASNPSTVKTRMARIEVLGFIGRYDEAREELGALESTTPAELFEAASLRQYIDWLESGANDFSELAAAVERLPPGSEARRMGDVNVALADARIRFMTGDAAWSNGLQAVRPTLGREASMVVLRDTWLRLAAIAFAIGFVASVVVLLLR